MGKCTVKIISKNLYMARTVVLLAEELGFDASVSEKADGNINVIDSSARLKDSYDASRCIYLFERGETIPKGVLELLSKPFAWDDMRKSIKNVYDRLYGGTSESIMIAGRELLYSGKRLEMSDKELKLFSYLHARENLAVSRTELLASVWQGKESGTNITDVYINYVRNKIRDAFGLNVIRSVRGIGYMYTNNRG